MTKVQIKHRYSNDILFECSAPDGLSSGRALRYALEVANLSEANLSGADLSGADLSEADLSRTNLSRTNLSEANLSGADLSRADLSLAYLSEANLSEADLSEANLSGANLSGAYLSRTNLSGADLSRANLSGANLSGADLSRADLSEANLSGADLSEATGTELAIAQSRILAEGALIGWKKCSNGVIVKLRVPEEAKRSHAFGRKCRAEFVDVIEVIGAEVGISRHDGCTKYQAGKRVVPDSFSTNWQEECQNGIHFFITREEAEAY